MAAVREALGLVSAIAYCTPTQNCERTLTAPPTLNPTAVFTSCAEVTVAVSPPFEGNAADSVNLLPPVCAPTFAEISNRGCTCDCAAAGVALTVPTRSSAADNDIWQVRPVII